MGGSPVVSIIIPAKDEEAYLPSTLESIDQLVNGPPIEVIVVNGESNDKTAAIAKEWGATVISGSGTGIGHDRNLGATEASGEWYAFVDADTIVAENWLVSMWSFILNHEVIAATSKCRMPGIRAGLMAWTINEIFSRLRSPILPGFNFWVASEQFEAAGGFPCVTNEDTAFSRILGRMGPTAFNPDCLVSHSPRRIEDSGLTGTAYHYARLDIGRIRGSG